MEITLKEAVELFQIYKLEEAKEAFEFLVKNNTNLIDSLVYLGKTNARIQNYGEALNNFNKALELQPDNIQAKTGITLTQNILQLANNYYYENPYTDDDLYNF